MVQKLSERPEKLVRDFLADNLRKSELNDYDPQQTDTQAVDYLPITNDYSRWGETFPMIWVGEQESPNTPGGGESGYSSVQGDGSGPNQYTQHNITVSVQTKQGGGYLNGVDYDDLAYTLYQEVHAQVQNNTTTGIDELVMTITPPGQTRETEGDTTSFYQRQGTIQSYYVNEP